MKTVKIIKTEYRDTKIDIKIKLSSLWVSVMFCYIYGDYFELYVPKRAEGLVTGENVLDSPLKLFLASQLMTFPAIMIFLSIFLKPRINKLINISFGFLFTAIMLLIALNSLTVWRTFYVYLAVVEMIITSMIVWYAIKWPKQTTYK